MYLKAGLPKLGLKPECYSGLIDGTAERFAHQLSKRVIELGCDYLAKEIRKASTTKIKMIKTLAEDTCSWWRKKSPNHEHLNELKQKLGAIIDEANVRLKQFALPEHICELPDEVSEAKCR